MINRKIAISAVSIFAAFALMGGATYAFFSSTATSTGNVFATGSLTLLLDDVNETTPAATVTASIGDTDLMPGETVLGSISMHNGGTVTIAEVNVVASQTATSTPDLADKLNITLAQIGDNDSCSVNTVTVTGSFPATLAALNADVDGVDLPSTSLAAGTTKYLCMTYTLDPTTDNTYQGKSITETFTFVGHQDLSQ